MIQPSPTAPEGRIVSLPSYDQSIFGPTTAILCRNTAPLVSFAYSLLHRDIPCTILGRDIGAQLISLVQKMHSPDLETLRERLAAWRNREVERACAEDRNPDRIEDQYACLCFFINGLDESSRTVASLVAKIELMFSDVSTATSKVLLATIHKAKGLEWESVFLLDRNLIPSRYAKKPWQIQQEKNLLYVAITRAKLNLFYIQSDCWKDKE